MFGRRATVGRRASVRSASGRRSPCESAGEGCGRAWGSRRPRRSARVAEDSEGPRPRSCTYLAGAPRKVASNCRTRRRTWRSYRRRTGAAPRALAPPSRWQPPPRGSGVRFAPFSFASSLVGSFAGTAISHRTLFVGLSALGHFVPIPTEAVARGLFLVEDRLKFILLGFELGALGRDLGLECQSLAFQLALAAFDL